MRVIRKIYRGERSHWVGDGFLVRPLFSHMDENRATDPFLMLDYAAPRLFAPNTGKARGVGAHPHKGFETVTIAYQGEVAHRDSAGGGGVIKEGDVQWMTAGAGIVHEEFHSEAFSRRGGMFEMVQLWVNLPQAHKNTPPRYQHLPAEKIPVITLPEHSGSVRLIAGRYGDTRGAADTFSELNVWDVTVSAGQQTTLTLPDAHTLAMIVLRGTACFNRQHNVTAGAWASFEPGGGGVEVHAGGEDTRILLLSGVPLNEPVVGYGPFVMNTHEEIRTALEDYRHGRFATIR